MFRGCREGTCYNQGLCTQNSYQAPFYIVQYFEAKKSQDFRATHSILSVSIASRRTGRNLGISLFRRNVQIPVNNPSLTIPLLQPLIRFLEVAVSKLPRRVSQTT